MTTNATLPLFWVVLEEMVNKRMYIVIILIVLVLWVGYALRGMKKEMEIEM